MLIGREEIEEMSEDDLIVALRTAEDPDLVANIWRRILEVDNTADEIQEHSALK